MRGRDAVDMAALEQLLVRFSELVVEQPQIAEIEINPLLASADRLLALDARVILHPADLPPEALPRPAIRPYPLQYSGSWTDRVGATFAIRPIRPEDETLLVAFHRTLSEQSIYQRYFENLGLDQRIAHERLIRVCFSDYDRELALVAVGADADGGPVMAGVGRLSRLRDGLGAEFAVLVSDRFQGHGLGSALLDRLVHVGREEGLGYIVADVLATNGAMLRLARDHGFVISDDPEAGVVHARLDLGAS